MQSKFQFSRQKDRNSGTKKNNRQFFLKLHWLWNLSYDYLYLYQISLLNYFLQRIILKLVGTLWCSWWLISCQGNIQELWCMIGRKNGLQILCKVDNSHRDNRVKMKLYNILVYTYIYIDIYKCVLYIICICVCICICKYITIYVYIVYVCFLYVWVPLLQGTFHEYRNYVFNISLCCLEYNILNKFALLTG